MRCIEPVLSANVLTMYTLLRNSLTYCLVQCGKWKTDWKIIVKKNLCPAMDKNFPDNIWTFLHAEAAAAGRQADYLY
jgi:hypothetical protein